MDGNGRWAKQRGLVRSLGHQAGAETVHVIAEEASNLGVKYLTLYTFSTENWESQQTRSSSINESSDGFYRKKHNEKTISVSVLLEKLKNYQPMY